VPVGGGTPARTGLRCAQDSSVYGRQLQQPADEQPAGDVLGVASLTIDQRHQLVARILSQHPHLADELRALRGEGGTQRTGRIRNGSLNEPFPGAGGPPVPPRSRATRGPLDRGPPRT
jgi:hypothetical protein